MKAPTPGVCRHCGCDELHACMLATGDPCCWTDSERTVCSQPSCLRAEKYRLAALRKKPGDGGRKHGDRYAGWGYGAIVEDMRRRGRARRKGRAA